DFSPLLRWPRGESSFGIALIFKAIAYEMVRRDNTVGPADLLAFGVGASVIRNRYFVDANSQLCQLHRHLGFHAEAVGTQIDLRENFAAKHFVAGGHVMNTQAGEHVA